MFEENTTYVIINLMFQKMPSFNVNTPSGYSYPIGTQNFHPNTPSTGPQATPPAIQHSQTNPSALMALQPVAFLDPQQVVAHSTEWLQQHADSASSSESFLANATMTALQQGNFRKGPTTNDGFVLYGKEVSQPGGSRARILAYFSEMEDGTMKLHKVAMRNQFTNALTTIFPPTPVHFNNDINCYWQNKGSIANGVVALLPQMHAPAIGNSSAEDYKAILKSQKKIFLELKRHNAQHVFSEGMEPKEASELNNASEILAGNIDSDGRAEISHMYVTALSIARKLKGPNSSIDSLTHEEKTLLAGVGGGALVYCLASQDTTAPCQMHPTVSPEQTAAVTRAFAAHNTNMYVAAGSPLQHRQLLQQYMLDKREEFAFSHIKAAKLGPNSKAFLVYGSLHKFDKAFDREDAPALYRSFRTTSAHASGVIQPNGEVFV